MEEMREKKEPKVWSKQEKLLLIAALVMGVLFDRIVVNWHDSIFRIFDMRIGNALFWLGYITIFYIVFWRRLKKDYVLWIVAACAVALALWNFIFFVGNWQYGTITFIVIPAVLMAHAQWAAYKFSWKRFDSEVFEMVSAWFQGWVVKPLSGIPAFWDVSTSLVSEESKPVAKRVGIGVLITLGLMIVIIPLLMGADQVFGYYVQRIFSGIRFSSIIFHGLVILLATGLFYSFLWNVGYGENTRFSTKIDGKIDNVISGVVLGGIIFVYSLYCVIQFAYLFAQMELPQGLEFAQYARQGFAQTVAVCAINLLIFGVFMWLGSRGKMLTAMLSVLLGLTGIMIVSGMVRVSDYIEGYGMTWLRLLSVWFIIYLAVVVILCFVRLFLKKEMPLIGICVLLLLVWYVVLGYLNPDEFIRWFNWDFHPPRYYH
jgi:hypothetical protein